MHIEFWRGNKIATWKTEKNKADNIKMDLTEIL
jgi:hypothetical protein